MGMRHRIIAFSTAAVLFLLSALVPTLVAAALKPLPADATYTQQATSPDGATLTREITLTPGALDDVVHAHITWAIDGETVTTDDTSLVRDSAFATLDSGSDGLHTFFPTNTERRTYQIYDPATGTTEAADYHHQDGHNYVFRQAKSGNEYEVEPRTGTVLAERITLDGHTFELHATNEQRERMEGHLTLLQVTRIGGFLAKIAGFAALFVGLWLLVRRPR